MHAKPLVLGTLAFAAALAAAAVHGGNAHAGSTGGSQRVIATADFVVTTDVPGRVDGTFHVPGAPGAFLLLRATTGRDGFFDALYRVRRGRLERVHVRGPFGDGLITAYVGTTYVDIDCGPRVRTVVQVVQQPIGRLWRRALLTFTLRGRTFDLTHVSRGLITSAEAGHRRCNVARR